MKHHCEVCGKKKICLKKKGRWVCGLCYTKSALSQRNLSAQKDHGL